MTILYTGLWDQTTLVPPMILTDSNAVATLPSAVGVFRGAVRSTPSFTLSSTPTFIRFDPTVVGASSAQQLGICNAAYSVEFDIPGTNANSIGITVPGSLDGGVILLNESPIGAAAEAAQGNIIIFALTTTTIWVSCDDGVTWNGGTGTGGDPNTPTGGYPISGLNAGPYFAVVTMEANTGAQNSLQLLSTSPSEATLADLFFAATPSFVDFSIQANRRLFINVNGGAQNLKPDGSGPYANTPPVFLSLEGNALPDTFAQNKGRGGTFLLSGPDLTAGASNPPETSVTVTTASATVPFSGVLGDYQSGNIYAFNPATLTDNGAQRKWVRRWRALPGDTTSAVTFSYLNIGMETGTEIPAGTLPQLVLRWSDDGGKTWSGNRIVPVGATGQTAFTVKFNRLGSTKRFGGSTRIFELSSTDPFKVSIISAEVLTK
jgi:hypothetical protein